MARNRESIVKAQLDQRIKVAVDGADKELRARGSQLMQPLDEKEIQLVLRHMGPMAPAERRRARAQIVTRWNYTPNGVRPLDLWLTGKIRIECVVGPPPTFQLTAGQVPPSQLGVGECGYYQGDNGQWYQCCNCGGGSFGCFKVSDDETPP